MKVSNINLTTVIRQSEDIDATDLNGDKVMMNLQKGQYFALNGVGSRIWDIISRTVTVKDIINTLLKEYEVDAVVCEETVVSFLEKLKDAELISIN
jgi:hypothetical protein